MKEQCGWCAPLEYELSEKDYIPYGEHDSDRRCLLAKGHKESHLLFLKWKAKYIYWINVDDASDMKDLCEECPWVSEENMRIYDECTCLYYGETSEEDAKMEIKKSFQEVSK